MIVISKCLGYERNYVWYRFSVSSPPGVYDISPVFGAIRLSETPERKINI